MITPRRTWLNSLLDRVTSQTGGRATHTLRRSRHASASLIENLEDKVLLAGNILTENFTDSSQFTTSAAFFSDDAVSSGSDFFGISDGAGGGDFGTGDPAATNVKAYTGFTGNFLTGMDLDGEGATLPIVLDWTGLDINGETGLQFSADFAEFFDSPGDIDASDFIRVEAQIDGGGFVNILEFRGSIATNGLFAVDTDLDGTGDGTALGNAAQNISANIAGVGAALDLRISISLNSGDEDFGIDNVCIAGAGADGLTVAITEDSLSEGGGTATATVTRSGDTTGDLVVNLTTDDASEATVPMTVTILDGQASATFDITAVDDMEADGTQTVTIGANAAGLTSGSDTIDITDNELSLTVDADTLFETGTTATATITRPGDTTGDLVVNLVSNDVTEATVPATVTILDGEASATFTITGVDDAIADGTVEVTITASAAGFGDATVDLKVGDDEAAAPTDLFINEILVNPSGSDTGNEYIEFRGTANTTITANTYLLVIEGDDGQGVIDQIFTLDGMTIGSNGFLVLLQAGSTLTTDPNSSVVTAAGTGWGDTFSSRTNDLENGSTSFLLVQTNLSPIADDDVDAEGDGVLDGAADNWTILDSVGNLDGGGTDTAYGAINFSNDGDGTSAGTIVNLETETGGTFTPDYLARNGNSTGMTAADWVASDVTGTAPTFAIDTTAALPGNASGDLDHIGAENPEFLPPALTVTIDEDSFSENSGTSTATVTRSGDTTGDLVVTLTSDDTTEATVPMTVTILDGEASATFTITGVDDAIVDGAQTVTITATAAGLEDGTDTVDVTSDDPTRDGGENVGVFRNGPWWLDSNGDGVADLQRYFGSPTQVDDVALVGDYNGDGVDDVGIFRNGTFLLDSDGSGVFNTGDMVNSTFALDGDIGIVGDWNGDGTDQIGVFRIRAGGARFALDLNGDGAWSGTGAGGDLYIAFGVDGDSPLIGDWNGDGTDEVGVSRDRNGQKKFLLDANGDQMWSGTGVGGDLFHSFGLETDTAIVGDWDGDGTDNIGVHRSIVPPNAPMTTEGRFYMDLNGNGTYDGREGGDDFQTYGMGDDIAVIGNWV